MLVTIRARAFSGSKLANIRVMVANDDVLVHDDVAGHYTRCHALTEADMHRAISKAQRATAERGVES